MKRETEQKFKVFRVADEKLESGETLVISEVAREAGVCYRTAWNHLKSDPSYAKWMRGKGLLSRLIEGDLTVEEERACALFRKGYKINKVVEITGLKLWKVNLLSAHAKKAKGGNDDG